MSLAGENFFGNCFIPELSDNEIVQIMQLKVPIAVKEPERIYTLRSSGLLDTSPEDAFDRYTSLASRVFKVPIALVSLVDTQRQWFKSRVGLLAPETHRNHAFCAYTVLEEQDDVFVVHDTYRDARFCSNVLVTGSPFIRFYAGAALVVNGQKIGSVCVIDTNPRPDFGPEEAAMLKDITSMVVSVIEERRRRLLDYENDLTRVVMALLHSLKYPLQLLQQKEAELLETIKQAVLINTDYSLDCANEVVSEFQQHIARIHYASSVTTQSAACVAMHQPTMRLNVFFMNIYRYIQEQRRYSSGIFENSFQYQLLHETLHKQSLRMIEIVGKLQNSLIGLSTLNEKNDLVWDCSNLEMYDNFSKGLLVDAIEHTIAIAPREKVYYTNFNVLEVVLTSLLIVKQSQWEQYHINIQCSFEESTNSWDNQPASETSRNGELKLAIRFQPRGLEDVNNMARYRAMLYNEEADDVQKKHEELLEIMVKIAEGTFRRSSYWTKYQYLNKKNRHSSADGRSQSSVSMLSSSAVSYVEDRSSGVEVELYTISLPCIVSPYEPPMSPLSVDSYCTDLDYDQVLYNLNTSHSCSFHENDSLAPVAPAAKEKGRGETKGAKSSHFLTNDKTCRTLKTGSVFSHTMLYNYLKRAWHNSKRKVIPAY